MNTHYPTTFSARAFALFAAFVLVFGTVFPGGFAQATEDLPSDPPQEQQEQVEEEQEEETQQESTEQEATEEEDESSATDGEKSSDGEPSYIDTGNATSTAGTDTVANVTSVDPSAPASTTPNATSTPTSGSADITIDSDLQHVGTTTGSTNTGRNESRDLDGAYQRTGAGFSSAGAHTLFDFAMIDSALHVEYFLNPLEDVIDFMETMLAFFSPVELAASTLESGLCGWFGSCTEEETTLTIDQTASIVDTVEAFCNTGGNSGGIIMTGACRAIARILNLGNWVLLNSNVMFLLVEQDGDLNADIMLPEPAFFEGLRGGMVASGTNLSITQNATTSCASTATATTGGNLAEDAVFTGNATSSANCFNFVNQFNPPTCFVVSVSGHWNGEIYQLPSGFTAEDTTFGTVICGRGTGSGDPVAYNGVIRQDLTLIVDAIASATTGENEGDAILTGDALACSDAFNVGNLVLTNEDWTLGFFSICGDWNGDLTFGARPDATPTEEAVSNVITTSTNKGKGSSNGVRPDISVKKYADVTTTGAPSEVAYTIVVSNDGGNAYNVLVKDVLTDPNGKEITNETWNLDTVRAGEEVKITYTVTFGSDAVDGTYTNTATLTGDAYGKNEPYASAIEAVSAKNTIEVNSNFCPQYLKTYIREGADNNEDDVRRLQIFLIESEGEEDVVENGIYDSATIAAVHRFQKRNAGDVLSPWGYGESTGYVYYTTQKKINELYCQGERQFPLSGTQESEISRVRTILQDAFFGGGIITPELYENLEIGLNEIEAPTDVEQAADSAVASAITEGRTWWAGMFARVQDRVNSSLSAAAGLTSFFNR